MHQKAEVPDQAPSDITMLALSLSKTEVFVGPQWKTFFSIPKMD